jgi:hypothetical protein
VTRELISKATRNEFREVLVGFVLREIEMMFDAAGMQPRTEYNPPVTGQRRSLVEQYYANVDFASVQDVCNVVAAYEEVIEQLRRAQNGATDPAQVGATIQSLIRRMERDGFHYEDGRFVSERLRAPGVNPVSLVALSEESITEHVEKVRAKIEAGDNAGAIASAYTLIEGFLKEILRQKEVAFKQDEGDIRELYKLASGPLNLNPAGENLESYLKSILQGLKSQVTGLYELANKASDRHVRRYNPAGHHAKLAVNSAFTLCEFLLDSWKYQQLRQSKSASQ